MKVSEEIGSMRNDLSMHRIGLLEFLNRVGHKIVDLDDDRIIRKTHVISSKFFLRGGWGNWDIMFTM